MLSYSPYYEFGATPDDTASPITETALSHGDFANSSLKAFASTTVADYSRVVSRRDTLSFSYNLRRTIFDDQSLNVTAQTARVWLLHRLTKSVSLRTGYGYDVIDSAFTQLGAVRNHDLDLGLDYSRALGPAKRTTFSVSSGSSATPSEQGTSFNVIGNAALVRQIGRTWRTRLVASRSVELLEGFTRPVLSNNGVVDVGGNLSRRMSASASVRYSTGTVGMDPHDSATYDHWSGSGGLRVMLSRWTALETQYSYYGHRFGQDVQLAPGVVSGLRRQGLRVSLTWFHPVLQ